MNKEIIDILNELLKIPQSTNGTLNFYEIESSKFEAIITLVKKQLEDLQHQLEEKDKVIDEILNHPFFTNECPYSSIGDGFVQELCDCDNCQEDYKKCWIKYFKNEILERGKNGK